MLNNEESESEDSYKPCQHFPQQAVQLPDGGGGDHGGGGRWGETADKELLAPSYDFLSGKDLWPTYRLGLSAMYCTTGQDSTPWTV